MSSRVKRCFCEDFREGEWIVEYWNERYEKREFSATVLFGKHKCLHNKCPGRCGPGRLLIYLDVSL